MMMKGVTVYCLIMSPLQRKTILTQSLNCGHAGHRDWMHDVPVSRYL